MSAKPNAQELLDAIVDASRTANARGYSSANVIMGGIWMTVHLGANCREIPSGKIEWRRCSEELPPNDSTVIIHCPGSRPAVWLGWFDRPDSQWYDIEGRLIAREPLTHWAPMPLPPFDPATRVTKQRKGVRR